jgi:hypothetical protein
VRCRSGDNAPAFALGQLKVLRGRYMVTYRLVNAVYVMVVTTPSANAFLCVQLLEAVTKILVAAAKGVDVTADKIARKYQEVSGRPGSSCHAWGQHAHWEPPIWGAEKAALPYVGCGVDRRRPSSTLSWQMHLKAGQRPCMHASKGPRCSPSQVYSLLDGLLDGGLAVLPPAFAHRSATADMLLTMPASATDAAHKLKKMFLAGKAGVAGLPKKVGEGGAADPTPPPVPETPAQAEGRCGWGGGGGGS